MSNQAINRCNYCYNSVICYKNNLTISPVTVLMMTFADNAYDDSSNNRDSKKDNSWQLTFQF